MWGSMPLAALFKLRKIQALTRVFVLDTQLGLSARGQILCKSPTVLHGEGRSLGMPPETPGFDGLRYNMRVPCLLVVGARGLGERTIGPALHEIQAFG